MSMPASTLDAAQLRGIIERDRQQFLGLVETLRREVESRRYLADEGIARSPLDTDLHRTDFGEAVTAMLRKLDHARTVVTCWPIGESVQLLAEGDLCSLNPECPYYGPPPCPHPPLPPANRITFSLGEAKALVAFFGGHNGEISVGEWPARQIDGVAAPAGKYAWCTEYPEEGAQWLGEHDVDTEAHDDAPLDRKPLDDPRHQELFVACITGAMAFGSQGVKPPPEGHWLEPFWTLARDAQATSDERDRLRALVNHPHTLKFLEATRLEVAHQVERWGTVHDRAKAPADWYWLLAYLTGKALAAHIAGDLEKARHHTISGAAVLANWHAAIGREDNRMQPGSSDLQQFLEEQFGDAAAIGGEL